MIRCDAWLGLALPVGGILAIGLAAIRAPRFEHERVRREGGTPFLGSRLMHYGYGWIDALAGIAARGGCSANVISWLSGLVGFAAGVLAYFGWFGSAAWALALSGLCDGIDGAVARRQQTAGRAGAVLDSALDRYVEFFFFAGLVGFFAGQTWFQLLAVAACFGGFMVTYSTAKAEALQIPPPRGWMKRAERMVWLTGGSAFAAAAPLVGVEPRHVWIAALSVIAVFAHASAVVRLRALIRAAAK